MATATLTPEMIAAQHREAQAARFALGADRNNRRIGGGERISPRRDDRSEEQKVSDLALVQQATAIQQAQEVGIQSKEDMVKAVEVAYSAGRNQLTRPQIMAVALLCWELGLSPNPTLGHVYGFNSSNGFVAAVGISGMVNLARRDHEFILRPSRLMTDEERSRYGLEPEDCGVMVGIIDMREFRPMAEIVKAAGIHVTLEELLNNCTQHFAGTWKKKARRNKEGAWVEDNIPATWDKYRVAEKRATTAALRRLGLNSNVGRLPDIPGFAYDADEGGYVEVHQPEPIQIEGTAQSAIEDVEAILEQQVAETFTPIETALKVAETSAGSVIDGLPKEVVEDTHAAADKRLGVMEYLHDKIRESAVAETKITSQQAGLLSMAMEKHMSKAARLALIKVVSGKESAKELTLREYQVMMTYTSEARFAEDAKLFEAVSGGAGETSVDVRIDNFLAMEGK